MNMADYKRMISYMYQYENGVKKKNVGFARIEAKDGQCKITLHMQLLGQLDSIFPTYLIQRNNEGMELIYLGDTILKNQVMDSKLSANENNIMETGYGLSDMGGLLLFLNDSIFFATEWDDKPIVAKEVLEAMSPKAKQVFKQVITERQNESVSTLEEELTIPKYKLPRGYKTIERLQETLKETLRESLEEPSIILAYYGQDGKMTDLKEQNADQVWTKEKEEQKSPEENDTLYEEQAAQVTQATETEDLQTANIRNPGASWQMEQEPRVNAGFEAELSQEEVPNAATDLLERYPRIYPFEDNEILVCVKIEPKDIGLLPKELWVLSNNSFLVHGYYCYHHLIFAKMKDRYGTRFILGIPGIYHDRERFMARMFGFDSFKPIRRRELRQGDFGYWYLPVNF